MFNKFILIFIFLSCSQIFTQAQTKEKCNFYLKSVLEQMSEADHLNVAVHGDRDKIIGLASRSQRKFYPTRTGAILGLNKNEILSLNELEYIDHIEFHLSHVAPLNDVMLSNNNIIPVHQGIDPLNEEYTGEDIIVGVIDSGIELAHPDFLDDDGKTRVLYLWDHKFEDDPNKIPPEYGYGNVWTQEDINEGLSTHVDQIEFFGHGSVVTGVATGDGSAVNNYKGVAPDSEMIIVSSDFDREDWLASIVDAVDFIYNKASEMGKPCVINASLGDYYGSHDGLDAYALAIDELIASETGRAFVCAAGNSGALPPYHLKYEVTPDTSFTWFKYNANSALGYGSVFFELWADTVDFGNVYYGIGADKVNPGYSNRGKTGFYNVQDNIDVVITDSIKNMNGDILGIVDFWATIRGAQYQLQVHLQEPDSSQYNFRFSTTGEGTFDVWSTGTFGTSFMVLENELPTASDFPDIVHYKLPDDKQQIVSSFACSDKTLTVGNYVNRESYVDYNNEVVITGYEQGEISPTSSQGPTRDGKLKPDITATGAFTLSSGSFEMLNWLINNEPFKVAPGGFHNRNGGTSMASPVIAGLGALFFEQCPRANYETFIEAVHGSGTEDGYSGQVPNDRWGNGKVDGFAAISSYTVNGTVTENGDNLLASGGIDYQWYYEGELLDGETNEMYTPQSSGIYLVDIYDDNGCRDRETIFYNFTDISELNNSEIRVYPNPTNDWIKIENSRPVDLIQVFEENGKQCSPIISGGIDSSILIDLSEFSSGIYYLRFVSSDKVYNYSIVRN